VNVLSIAEIFTGGLQQAPGCGGSATGTTSASVSFDCVFHGLNFSALRRNVNG
jgi:hypothetical protein